VGSAHEPAKALMVELRDLVRGIRPRTLRELGLRAATEELAAGSPLRVHVVAAVGDAAALVTAAGETGPDLVVTDVRMPPGFADEGQRAAVVAAVLLVVLVALGVLLWKAFLRDGGLGPGRRAAWPRPAFSPRRCSWRARPTASWLPRWRRSGRDWPPRRGQAAGPRPPCR
jgi:CheY-like chemotaxis protein